MDTTTTLPGIPTSYTAEIPQWNFFVSIVLAAILAWMLGRLYVKFGKSLSNRKAFAWNFVLIAVTTTLIITIVKSSLALSLGLVGALSIVRFRTAIKEPEELAYLFIAISVGLGCGADQWAITAIGFAVISVIICILSFGKEQSTGKNLYLTVSSSGLRLKDVISLLKNHCDHLELKRFDDQAGALELAFMASFADATRLEEATNALKGLDEAIHITLIDNDGIL